MERNCKECKHYVLQNTKINLPGYPDTKYFGCELWECHYESATEIPTTQKPLENIINETFEEVKVSMCEDYCRYPREWNEEEEGAELIDSEICRTCPLNRL